MKGEKLRNGAILGRLHLGNLGPKKPFWFLGTSTLEKFEVFLDK